MTKEYMIDRIARNGYKVTILGKNIRAERTFEKHQGSISSVYKTIFEKNKDLLLRRLERELAISKEYARGLEELLYKKTVADIKQNKEYKDAS